MNINQIFEDFDRKYQGSYVQVAFEGKQPELFRLMRIVYDSSKFPKLELSSDRLGTVLLNYNTSARILFKVPSATYLQQGNQAVFFRRMAERQWKRGVHHNNSTFNNPLSSFMLLESGSSSRFDFTNIRNAFNPTFYTLQEALTMLNKDYRSVALSRNFCIAKGRKDVLVLFYRLMPVGTVSKDGTIDAPDFQTEVRDEIK